MKDKIKEVEKVIRENIGKKKMIEIAKMLGISKQRLYQIIQKYNLPKKRDVRKPVIAPIIAKCIVCGKELVNPPSMLKYKKYFCSIMCKRKYYYEELTCFICGKKFLIRKKELKKRLKKKKTNHFFCSRKCLGKYIGINFGFGNKKY